MIPSARASHEFITKLPMAEPPKRHAEQNQFTYCSICRRNHDQGRKHIFTKHHKDKLSGILTKLMKKVKAARKVLHKPKVYEGELEPGSTMWCYCCGLEINKHVTDGLTSVEWGGLLEHLACSSHHKKTRSFWWEHGADKSQLQSMLIFDAELQRFKKSVVEAMEKLETARDKRVKEAAEKIRDVEQSRLQFATSEQTQAGPSSSGAFTSSTLTAQACSSRHSARGERKKPVGNVHTGATPPWLMDEDDEEEDDGRGGLAAAGPSLEAFLSHKERQSWASKNPMRVGADFHQRLKSSGQLDVDDDDWLPSFGRVWNFGPRLHSKVEFRNQLVKKPDFKHSRVDSQRSCTAQSALSTSKGYTGDLHHDLSASRSSEAGGQDIPRVVPYVRKRPPKRQRTDEPS